MRDLPKSSGSFDTSHTRDRAPREGKVPEAGICNETHGQLADKGPGSQIPPNRKRIG